MNWKLFGDVNPIEHGGVWLKQDRERSFHIIEIQAYSDAENKWRKLDAYVDLNDEWIDVEAVKSFSELGDDASDEQIAVAVVHYHGNHLSSSGDYETIEGYFKVVNDLKNHEIKGFSFNEFEYLKDRIQVSTSLLRREIYVQDENNNMIFSLQEDEDNEFDDELLKDDREAKDYVLRYYEEEVRAQI